MGKASERGLESCGSTPKPLCRKCNTWMFCGKPFMGKTLKCQKDMAVFDHESYKDDTALPAVILNSMTHQGGFVRGPPLDTNAEKWAMYNALVAMPEGTVKTVREWLKWFPEVKFGESSEPPTPMSIDLGDVELRAHTPDPSNESLSNLIAANGGPEAFATFLDSERELKEILDARADKSFLQSAYTMVTPPTPGVAATTDCGEPQQHAQRLETMSCIGRTRILTDLPLPLHGCLPGNAQTLLEGLDEGDVRLVEGLGGTSVRSFSDVQVRDAAIQASMRLATSPDTEVRRAATKFSAKLAAMVAESANEPTGPPRAHAQC